MHVTGDGENIAGPWHCPERAREICCRMGNCPRTSKSVEFETGLPASRGSGPIGSMQVAGLVPRRHVAGVLVNLRYL